MLPRSAREPRLKRLAAPLALLLIGAADPAALLREQRAAGELVDAEQIAGTGLQVHIAELELGFHVSHGIGMRNVERPPDDATIDLRFTH